MPSADTPQTPHGAGARGRPLTRWTAWRGALVWLLAWLLMLGLDGQVDLANQAQLLVLASAMAALWWSAMPAMAGSVLSVLLFNLVFVPPRGTLSVDLRQHGLLLLSMLVVSVTVALLMSRLRRLAASAREQARCALERQRLGEQLRSGDGLAAGVALLRELLQQPGARPVLLLLGAPPEGSQASESGLPPDEGTWIGEPDADEQAGLRLCRLTGQALGAGTGRHDEQPAWYLPLRGLQGVLGAALVPLPAEDGHTVLDASADALRHQAQALCDLLGAALERQQVEQAALRAREQAQDHALRNTLLSAIAHDYRTPLATIASAAGALHDQSERLDAAQRQRLAATILDESAQLARITDNTLQLARLDAVGQDLARDLPRDWESVEELVGSVLRRFRQRDAARRLRARVEPGLPLLRCDAVLMVQLLDNLVDNALRYGGDVGPVELRAWREGPHLVLAVRDRGPGVPPEQRERIFQTFVRGAVAPDAQRATRGTGVGLALCRAIARVHGGELRLRQRRGGGASFECVLPVGAPPEAPGERVAGSGQVEGIGSGKP